MTKEDIRQVLRLYDDFLNDYNERIKADHKDGKGSDLVIELVDITLTQGQDAARKIIIDRAVEYIHKQLQETTE
jgi:hypothetical protein